jgi:hypothetical protein
MEPSCLDSFHGNVEVEMAIREWLWMQESGFYHDRIFKVIPKCDKCINVLLGDYVEK